MFSEGSAAPNDRSAEFKTGLGDTEAVVKRHAEKARALRREKHDEKIQRMRNRNHYEPSAPATFELPKVIAARDAFIATQSLESIQYLKHFMHVSEADAMNAMLCVPFVEALLKVIVVANHVGVICAAADCLVNVMADINNENIPLIGKAVISKPAFYNVLNQHLCNNDSPIRFDMWKVLANLACMCQDARDVMVQSCVFSNPPPQGADSKFSPNGGSVHFPPPAAGGNAIFSVEFDKRDPATLPMLLVILMGFCASKDAVISPPFMVAHWKRLVHLLPFLLPAPQTEEQPMELLEYVLTVVQKVLEKTPEAFAVQLVALEPAMIAFTVGMCKRVSLLNYNQIRVQRILVMLSKYNTPDHIFAHAMRNAGCIQLMAGLSVSGNERVQKEALMWIGNYAAEGHAFVQHLLECNAFDGIVGFLRRVPKQHVLDQALYVLTAAVGACCTAARSAAVQQQQEIGGTLQLLLTQKHFLEFTSRHVGQMGCDTRTADILSMWVALLKWNRAFVQPILEESRGLERVDQLLGSQNPVIYRLASQVDDMVHTMDMRDDD